MSSRQLDPGSVGVVARKEFLDAVRSYALLAIAGLAFLVTLLFAGFVLSVEAIGGAVEATPEGLVQLLTTGATTFVPLIAIVVTYNSIVGERSAGSLALTLSLPHTRRDVFLGKFLGRGAIVLVAIAAAFVAGLVVTLWQVGFEGFGLYLTYVGLVSLLGLVYVAVGVAISGGTDSSIVAAVGSLLVFGLFRIAWTSVVSGWDLITNRLLEGQWVVERTEIQTWVEVAIVLNPHNAFGLLVDEYVYGATDPFAPRSVVAEADWIVSSPAVAALVLLAWIGIPLAVGLYRFESVDL